MIIKYNFLCQQATIYVSMMIKLNFVRGCAPLVIVDPIDSEIDKERENAGEKLDPNRPTIKERVEKAADEAGFEIVRIETFLPKDYIFFLLVKDI